MNKRAKIVSAGVVLIVALGAGLLEVRQVTEKAPGGQPIEQPTGMLTERFDSKNGYTMYYPKGWVVDDSQKEFPVDFINEPSGKAFVAIQTFQDQRLSTADGRKQVLKEAEDAFAKDENYSLGSLEWQNEDKGSESNSYFATGAYVDEGEFWKFMEIMIFSSDGTVFALRANAAEKDAGVYGPIASEILQSFVPTYKLSP